MTKTLTIPNGYWIASELADRSLAFGKGAEVYGDANPQEVFEDIIREILDDAGLDYCEECWSLDDVRDCADDYSPAWLLCEWCRDGIAEARAYNHARSVRY